MKRELLNSVATILPPTKPVAASPTPASPQQPTSRLPNKTASADDRELNPALLRSTGRRAAAVKVSEDDDDIDLSLLPKRVDRRAGAEILTRHFFPVSPRTIEAWPLTVRRLNGRALYETADLVAFARAKVAEAPAIRGGRRAGSAAA